MNVLEVCDNHVLNFALDIVRQFQNYCNGYGRTTRVLLVQDVFVAAKKKKSTEISLRLLFRLWRRDSSEVKADLKL